MLRPNIDETTTEDLIATCQYYPRTQDGVLAALTLERRCGPSMWSHRVFQANDMACALDCEHCKRW